MIPGYSPLLIWAVFVLYLGTMLHILVRAWWVFVPAPEEADDPRIGSCTTWLLVIGTGVYLVGTVIISPLSEIRSHSVIVALPASLRTIIAWGTLMLGAWAIFVVVYHGVHAYGASFLHEGKNPEDIARWAIRKAGFDLGIWVVPVALLYLGTVHVGSFTGALFGATSHILLKEWSKAALLVEALSGRNPTVEEFERIRDRLGDELADQYPISIYEVDPDDPIGDVVSAPTGVPGRRRILVGDVLVNGADDTIDATWGLLREVLTARLHDYHLLARTIRASLLTTAAVLVAPFVAPTPQFPVLAGTVLLSALVIAAMDYWFRRQVYDLDRRVARQVGTRAVEDLLDSSAHTRFESRLSRHRYLHPSVDDRIDALRSVAERW